MPSLGKKIISVCIIAIIIIAILTIGTILILRYQFVGETNIPFKLTKINLVCSTDGIDNVDENNKWNINVDQNNDIYLFISKNDNFQKTKIIESITLENFEVLKSNSRETKIYKPSSDSNDIFKNLEENECENITYIGDLQSDLKNLKISNQGGMITFRFTNKNVAQYVSNDAEEINFNNLLKECNVLEDDINATINFDLIIKLTDGKKYKSQISVDVPVQGLIEEGTKAVEITDTSSFIFKRIEN